MKSKDEILAELKANGWNSSDTDKVVVDQLIPALSEFIPSQEKVLSGLWGFGLDYQNQATTNKELFITTTDQILMASVDETQPQQQVVVKHHSLENVHKVLIQDSPNANKRVDVILIMVDDTWSIDTLVSDDLIKHFEDNMNQLLPQSKIDDQTFDMTQKAETIRIQTDEDDSRQDEGQTSKKGNWLTHLFKSFSLKDIFRNLEFWNMVSLIVAVAVLITASIATAGITRESVYIPNGIFTLVFGVIGMLAMIVISMVRWDENKFSADLYRSLFGGLVYLLTFVFGIVFSTGSSSASALGAVAIVLSVLLIFDGGYTITRHYLNY
ncbi:hypothetical protein LD119_00364 [Mesoplasma sp. JKS002660]|uniref:hypothetical protein n=1 Tax=Mesoplasma whartonense TaxID=2878854 RepID=UPI002022A129|nr:hypothetical protein [Mesoplasma sp. JKS002660]MCL8213436.1 hypothetical protein [Mesoplasma sp. JKS002660]